MTYLTTSLLLALSIASTSYAAEPVMNIPIGVSLFPPVDANPRQTKVIHNFELNLIYGKAYGLMGWAVGPGVNQTEADVTGMQIAGAANIAGGNTLGTQIAGVFNTATGNTQGAQISGIFNTIGGNTLGGQFTGIYNNIDGNLQGAQFTSIYNHTKGALTGVQIAIYNSSGGKLTGVQMGLVNRAEKMDFALQEGIVNIANDVTGVQYGGVNIADDVKGVQFGFVNISKHNKYGQIGMVNIDTSNYFKLYGGAGNYCAGIFGLRSGSKWLFGDVGLTMMSDDNDSGNNYLHVVNGIGMQTYLSVVHLSLEVLGTPYNETKVFFLMAGASVPLWDQWEGFVTVGPRIANIATYREVDYIAGIQYRLRDEKPE